MTILMNEFGFREEKKAKELLKTDNHYFFFFGIIDV